MKSMLARHHAPPRAWWMLVLGLVVIVVPAILQLSHAVEASVAYDTVQPILAVCVGIIAYMMAGPLHNRLHHTTDKVLMIGSVMSVWFVVYFLSGLVVTYVHNAVASSPLIIVRNLVTVGVAVVVIEYIRHQAMALASRRNIIWFGGIVSFVLAFQQIVVTQLTGIESAADGIKFVVAAVIPAFISSFLLTYLAVSCGFGAQLLYRLGVVAIMYIPPIIPKHDWYLAGISWIMLALAIYIVLDQFNTQADRRMRRSRHVGVARAVNASFIIGIGALAMFMVGAFSYRPSAIMSNSMHPVFSRGSIVIIQNAQAIDVSRGDIVQYEAHGRMVTHRVLSVDLSVDGSGSRVFITKGDNSPSADEPVKATQIRGIIRGQIPFIGYPTVWLRELTKK